MPSCSVKWCSNHTSTCSLKSKNGVSFHRFPKDEVMRQKWVEAVRFERHDPWWTSSNASRICSLHFKESDISSTPCKINILAKTAVPICTMVWYDDIENNIISKTPPNEITNKIQTILKTYERKKNYMNIFEETKLTISKKWNVNETFVSKTNKVVHPNVTSGFIQTNLTQELGKKPLKTLDGPKTQKNNKLQESKSFGKANENLDKIQKKTVLTEFNKNEHTKSNILLKLNDNTNIILNNNHIDTVLKESVKVNELNTETNEHTMKLILKSKLNDKQPNEEVNITNKDMFVKTVKNGNLEMCANISNTYLGKILKTYVPKRKAKINDGNIRGTCKRQESVNKKGLWSVNMEKGLNNLKRKEINKVKVNIYPKDAFKKTKLRNKKTPKFENLKENVNKNTSRKRNNPIKRPRIKENDKQTDIKQNLDVNNESNVIDVNELTANQSKIDKKNLKNTVHDDVISDFFNNSKNVGNDQESSKKTCKPNIIIADNNILNKETNKLRVIFYLDTSVNTEIDTFMHLGLNTGVNLGLNDKFITEVNKNEVNESNQQLTIINNVSMEHSDNIISASTYNMNTEIKDILKQDDQNKVVIFPNNELHLNETKKDIELKKHLSENPKLNSLAELCTNVITNIDNNLFSKENLQVSDLNHNSEFDKNKDNEVNDTVQLQNNLNTDAIKETESNVIQQLNSILLEEFVTNLSPQSNNSEIMDFITNFNTDLNKTLLEFNKNITDVDVECQKDLEKEILEVNTVIPSELTEDQLKPKEDMNTKFEHLNTEMYQNKDLLPESKNDFENVSISEDQHIVVNEHMDVVDSILNRETEFDLSLLLSDTPIPEEEIQNVGNNSNNDDYKSLESIEESPNWIQLPTDEMPQIIDDIMDQISPFFENLDIFDKVNTVNLDKAAMKENNEMKDPIRDNNSTIEQFEEEIINIFRETKNTTSQEFSEFSDYNETGLDQINNNSNLNKINQSKGVTAEKCYNLYDEQTDEQILEHYIDSNNDQCDSFDYDQNVDECYKHRDKESEGGNKSKNQTNILEVDQMENPVINQYFEQSEESHRELDDGLGVDKYNDILNYEDISKMSKKQLSNEQLYQFSIDQLIRIGLEESSPKSNPQNQDNLESSALEINKHTEAFNEEGNIISNEEHISSKGVPDLNNEQFKRVVFDQCFDPECKSNCKNPQHNSITEVHEKDEQLIKDQTNSTHYQPDVKNRKRRYDLLYKRQCIDNFKKHLNDGSFDSAITQTKHSIEHKSSISEDKTKYKKIEIDQLPGKYIELRWEENEGKSNSLSPERKHKKLGSEQSDFENGNFPQQIPECPECGYTTDDNLIDNQNDVDLRITTPLSLINKDMYLSLRDNNKVSLKSVYAMEFAYVTAIQALEKKLKQKIAISDYRLRRVNNLSKINNKLIEANIVLTDIADENKM